MKMIYKRHLPHIQPPGAVIFITFRLLGSLPIGCIEQLKAQYRLLSNIIHQGGKDTTSAIRERGELLYRYDDALHFSNSGPHHLKNPVIARMICDIIHYHDRLLYDLFAYCVMSNHVHVLVQPKQIAEEEFVPLEKITHSIKSYSSGKANKILNRQGQFWEHESFDHYCRSEYEEKEISKYILNNPVKAGLLEHSAEWPWSYCASSNPA